MTLPTSHNHTGPDTPRSGGFTLIELMAVVAILSILAVIALGSYADYVVRSKVSEGLTFAAEAKTSVSEYYYSTKRRPTNNRQAGLSNATAYGQYDYLNRLEIGTNPAGMIIIEFDIAALGTDNILHLVPSTADQVMSWTCQPAADNGIARSRVPPNCRD